MATTEKFRSALHGFNRNDVVQFIQTQTMTHERALRTVKDENTRLQEALTAAQEELESCRSSNADLSAQLEAAHEELEAARKELEAARTAADEARAAAAAAMEEAAAAKTEADSAKAAAAMQQAAAEEAAAAAQAAAPSLDAPMAPAVSVVNAVPSNFDELELAAYRRAEMTERMARERALASTERMKAIFAQAEEKLCLTSQDLNTLIDAIENNFDQMHQLLDTTRNIVGESSEGLKAAADVCEDV